MKSRFRVCWILLLAVVVGVSGAVAQDAEEAEAEAGDGETMESVEEVMVVTASRTEQRLQDAPATMTVIGAQELETAPADDFGDILRNVPGLNVSQMSARDIQITGRGATSSLATSELVLVDGRSIYLDFFGFVMWDYLPVDTREIKQVEVVRGPGSAVWGANAMTGVINLITKRPREMEGTSVMLGGGELGTAFGSLTHAGVRDRVGYKFSGSYYEQDPYDRPTGIIPGSDQPYPDFENQGTSQPKASLRIDYDADVDSTWSFSGGTAETDGIIHTGIGPFDIDRGASMSYVKAGWTKGSHQLGFFVNLLDGDAVNLLTFDPLGNFLNLGFESTTYNLDYSNTQVVGESHILTFGANARKNEFDLSLAPAGDNRDEYGVFLQDEVLIGDKVRWLVGGRFDDIDPIGGVFSPRTSLMVAASQNSTFRLSFNRAFRAPSLINNFLEVTISQPICFLPGVLPGPDCATPLGSALLLVPIPALGNPDVVEEQLDALELGYVGTFGTTTFSASVYRNETTDSIDFFAASAFTTDNPPPGWPPPGIVPPGVPPEFIPYPGPPDVVIPNLFTYRNVGEVVDQGVELSLNGRPDPYWSWFLNYSYQEEPEVTGIPLEQVNIPPENRFNLGLSYNGDRFFVNASANYQDEAIWTDVLQFRGPTDSFTMLNLGVGFHLGDSVTFSIGGQNVTDEDVQQHLFGDIISRKVTGKLLFRF